MLVFDDVTLSFPKNRSLFDLLFRRKRAKANRFVALKNITFHLEDGDFLGVIGRNGSGKSTLSLLCTQVYRPDSGKVTVNGKVQLLALGVGFQNQLSGRENVFISGSMLGIGKTRLKELTPEIEDFAEIGDFFDEPVRTYSSGMKSRLAFAIATAIRPDILILDEVMATGDKAFKDKAIARMQNLHDVSRAAIMVSHNPSQIRKLCNKVMWLDRGRIVLFGAPTNVLKHYRKFCENPESWKAKHPKLFPGYDNS